MAMGGSWLDGNVLMSMEVKRARVMGSVSAGMTLPNRTLTLRRC